MSHPEDEPEITESQVWLVMMHAAISSGSEVDRFCTSSGKGERTNVGKAAEVADKAVQEYLNRFPNSEGSEND